MLEKIAEGKIKKFYEDNCLIHQPFVKDPDVTIGSLLNKHRAKVLAFYRYEVGEGIEKKVNDFAAEVAAQAAAAKKTEVEKQPV